MIPIQLCGIVQLCCDQAEDCPVCPPGGQSPSERAARFDFLRLHSRDFRAGSLVLPSVLEVTGQLADWNKITFDSRQADEDNREITLDVIDTQIYSAAIYGRIFDLDKLDNIDY